MNELKEITKVDKELLDKIEHILASELNCDEYDVFYNYFNEIRKPNILIDIKDDENIKELITNLQSKIDKAIEYIEENILDNKIEKVDWDYDECYYSDMPVDRIKPLIDILKEAENVENN